MKTPLPSSSSFSSFLYYFSFFAFVLLYFLIYFFHLFQPSDYDLGWHLRYGMDVVHDRQLVRPNTYSTDLVGYKAINSSWLLDVLRYLLYQHTGMVGIAVVGGLTVTLTFFLIAKAFNFTLWQSVITLPILSLMMYAVNVHSLRGQEVSFLLTALLIYILRKYEKIIYSELKIRTLKSSSFVLYLTIPLFLVWANLNGQFVLGLGIYGGWVAIQLLRMHIGFPHNRLKFNSSVLKFSFLTLILPSVLSVFITLANPYGIHLYTDEIFFHGESPAIQFISEWAPINQNSGIVWFFLLGWGLVFFLAVPILLFQNKFLRFFPYLLASVPLYVASYFEGRYIWTMFLISSPFLAIIVGFLTPKNRVLHTAVVSIILLAVTFSFVKYELPNRNLGHIGWESYCDYTHCSPEGASFLMQNYPGKKMWTDYNYGGWLIWNYPLIKPSIDGRMPLWIDRDTRHSAFMDNYYPLETGQADPDTSQYDIFFVQNYRPLKKRLDDLVKNKKWKIAFQDKNATVYVREKIIL